MIQDDDEFFYKDEFQNLLSEYEKAMKEGNPINLDPEELTDIAEYYMTIYKEKKANKAISLALEMYPESIDPWIFVARQHLYYNRISAAEQICESLIDQNDREVIFLKAEIMIKKGQLKDAFDFFLEMAAMQNEDRGMFLYDCIQVFEDYQKWREARQFLTILKQEFPHYPKIKILEADILLLEGKYKDAIERLNQILDKEPYNVNAWNMLAEANAELGQLDEALDCIEYVLAIDKKNYSALITKANCKYMQELSEEAHKFYNEALSIRPGDAKTYYFDSICLTNMLRYNEASAQIKHAIKASAGMPFEQMQIFIHQAFIESKLHHLDAALKALDNAKSLTLECKNDFDYYVIRGEILLDNELKNEADDNFAKAIIESKNPLQTKISISVSFCEHGYYKDAEQLLLKIVEEYGDDASEAYAYLASCYINMHDDDKFLDYLRKSCECDPETTKSVFSNYFPDDVNPEMYYALAYWTIKGKKPSFPDNGLSNQHPDINIKID